jgi:Amt family ammonium transporter
VLCFIASTKIKKALGYDDALDCFGVHGIGGIVGAILTGIFVDASFGGAGLDEGVTIAKQVGIQFVAVAGTVVYDAIATLIILKIVDAIMGLRVTEEQETEGLDLTLHNERGYNL